MPLTIGDIEAAVALAPLGERSDFDLNPDVKAARLGLHEQRRAAVLCGLREREGLLHVVLTHRASHLSRHASQVAFPGGRVDPTDESFRHAALREAEEEIGLPPAQVRVIGTLDEYLTSTGYRVTPVVGIIAPDFEPIPDPGEVAFVFEPPLDFLMDPANRERHHHDRNGYRRYYYAMPWNGHYIWGATAGMLKGLSDRLEAVRDELP
ncbi:MAG TPA: CoA pyrophosphatase [Paracoccaceae bacterium]|nr:CoA pyrophosphatase [Paracoccaceae bacterium]